MKKAGRLQKGGSGRSTIVEFMRIRRGVETNPRLKPADGPFKPLVKTILHPIFPFTFARRQALHINLGQTLRPALHKLIVAMRAGVKKGGSWRPTETVEEAGYA